MTQPPPPGNVVPFPQTGLTGPLPGAIADLDSIARDIAFTRNCTASYLASFAAPQNQQDDDAVTLTRQALWFAGVISYRRAFTSGRGHLVAKGSRIQFKDAWKEVLNPEQQAAHDQVMQQANQHIAHRVADHEGAVVLAVLAPPPQPKAVAGVGVMLAVYVGPPVELAQQVISICDVLLAGVTAQKERLQNRCIELLQQEDMEDLYANATTPGVPPFPVQGE